MRPITLLAYGKGISGRQNSIPAMDIMSTWLCPLGGAMPHVSWMRCSMIFKKHIYNYLSRLRLSFFQDPPGTHYPCETCTSVLTVCENHLYAKIDKCWFHLTCIPFLGYIISPEGFELDPQQLSCSGHSRIPWVGLKAFWALPIICQTEVNRMLLLLHCTGL